ncbi:hypothetical protein O181_129165 [Austropuccinia psidii MF-1]|uniref:Uncharacterized protein n=1 Tax=Austropuccinia psidii MF-1 TaxID=1389203 RepID=A0A9Q3L1H5_9BASI|nr:hypothetical protein [Austropuccinia psidii MF-1]
MDSVFNNESLNEENFPIQTGFIDEFHPFLESAVSDEIHTYVSAENENKTLAISRIKIIWPRHPTLISSNLNTDKILPYLRQSNSLVTTASEAPQSFREAQNSTRKSKWIKQSWTNSRKWKANKFGM